MCREKPFPFLFINIFIIPSVWSNLRMLRELFRCYYYYCKWYCLLSSRPLWYAEHTICLCSLLWIDLWIILSSTDPTSPQNIDLLSIFLVFRSFEISFASNSNRFYILFVGFAVSVCREAQQMARIIFRFDYSNSFDISSYLLHFLLAILRRYMGYRAYRYHIYTHTDTQHMRSQTA